MDIYIIFDCLKDVEEYERVYLKFDSIWLIIYIGLCYQLISVKYYRFVVLQFICYNYSSEEKFVVVEVIVMIKGL